ncbi:MAG: SPOR domain-containing protein [Candidatus Limimorpha sp.]
MKQRQIRTNDSTIDGFRVQIFMGLGNNALHLADSVKTLFAESYPDVPAYLIFRQPYYRLRVGDFRTRLEAENLFQQLKNDFKDSFVTADRIEMPYNALCNKTDFLDIQGIDSLININKVFIEEEEFYYDTISIDTIDYQLFYDIE